MVPRPSPKAYSMVISLPKLAAVMPRPAAARPMHRTHARAGDSSPAKHAQLRPPHAWLHQEFTGTDTGIDTSYTEQRGLT